MTTHRQTANRPALGLGALLALCAATPAVLLAPQVAAQEAAVGMYKCERGGVVTFSDQPCGTDEQHIEVDYANPNNPEAAARANAAANQASQVAEGELLDTEIRNTQDQITRLQAERDARIAALRRERYDGTEQLDQQAWRAGMNVKIEATVQEYQTRLDTLAARLSDLQGRRAALSQP